MLVITAVSSSSTRLSRVVVLAMAIASHPRPIRPGVLLVMLPTAAALVSALQELSGELREFWQHRCSMPPPSFLAVSKGGKVC